VYCKQALFSAMVTASNLLNKMVSYNRTRQGGR
jgi:hypothetical protein